MENDQSKQLIHRLLEEKFKSKICNRYNNRCFVYEDGEFDVLVIDGDIKGEGHSVFIENLNTYIISHVADGGAKCKLYMGNKLIVEAADITIFGNKRYCYQNKIGDPLHLMHADKEVAIGSDVKSYDLNRFSYRDKYGDKNGCLFEHLIHKGVEVAYGENVMSFDLRRWAYLDKNNEYGNHTWHLIHDEVEVCKSSPPRAWQISWCIKSDSLNKYAWRDDYGFWHYVLYNKEVDEDEYINHKGE